MSDHTLTFTEWDEYLKAGGSPTRRTTVTTRTVTDPKHGEYEAPLFLRYVGPRR
jgi:hypothetical protein